MTTNPTPMAPKLTAPLPPLQQPLRASDRAGPYYPSDDTRPPLSRGTEQGGSLFPSEDARQQLSRGGTARGSYYNPTEDARQQQLLRGTEQGSLLPSEEARQQLMPRPIERGPLFSSLDGRPPMGRGPIDQRSIFLTSDDHALTNQILQLHSPEPRSINIKSLFYLVEDIIYRATQTVDGHPMGLSQRESMEGRLTLNGLEEVPDSALIIERISCEMTSKLLSGTDAHHTTLSVLRMLPGFTWEVKVVMTLAAFSLTYGDFWLLVQIYSTNPLAKSMALIKRLPVVLEHSGAYKAQFDAINNLIKAMLDTARCIVEFGDLPATYITDEDPEVKAALGHFPIAVYWVIRSAVAAAAQITTLSSTGFEYVRATSEAWELSNWAHKLKTISDHLRNTLNNMYRLIAEKKEIDSYNLIRKIIYHTMHIDNMKVLKILISASETEPALFDGPSKRRVHLDTLRRKNVLLLISGLDISHEELFILEQSYTESKMHAFEIIWIPVVDRSEPWTDAMKAQFLNLQASMPWHSVHDPLIIENSVIRFFREDWHFKGKPILVVLDPQGKVVSPNAIHMMWIWQSNAFPFTSIREELLWEQENWRLELLVDDIDPTVSDWIRQGKYIFMYGGDDLEWIRKFTVAAREVARELQLPLEMIYVGKSHHKEAVRKLSAAIAHEDLSHCWQEPAQVWYFWTRIESMIHSKIQLGKFKDHGDIILQEIQRLHSYDKAHGGWAVLAKGSEIVVHGLGRIALTALKEFDRPRALKEGFGTVYREFYIKTHMREHPCHRIEFPSTSKLPPSMLCPDCRREMQKYSSFICCHENEMFPADVTSALAPAPTTALYES